MRLFAAVVPPNPAIDDLDRAVAAMRDQRLSWTLTPSWHLTLAFYGDVDDGRVDELSRRLSRAAARYPSMRLRLSGAGRFGTSVLWTGVAGDVEPLKKLAASATASGRRIGLKLGEPRRFRPHVTLARSSRSHDLRPYVESLRDYVGPEWTATELVLVRSHLGAGPQRRSVYETLQAFPLGA